MFNTIVTVSERGARLACEECHNNGHLKLRNRVYSAITVFPTPLVTSAFPRPTTGVESSRLQGSPGIRRDCSVCVTPAGLIDQAVALARRPEVILCSFGDMLRVPGRQGDLLHAKAAAVTGVDELQALCQRHRVPVVVTGFGPGDLMDGILRCVRQLEDGRAELENAYARAVRSAGNVPALTMTRSVFEVIDREWRGLGVLPASGLGLRADYADFDAALRFKLGPIPMSGDEECLGGQVMLGTLRPDECPASGNGD
jgi:hydrogenase maturation factor